MVVTFTVHSAPVTLLGITCYAGIEPAGAAPRAAMMRLFAAGRPRPGRLGSCSLPTLPGYQLLPRPNCYGSNSVCQFNS